MLRCPDPLGPSLAQLAAGPGGNREARQENVYPRSLETVSGEDNVAVD